MTGIYPLPKNPSANDIILRSIIAHPSLFRAVLIKEAEMHDDYSRVTSNERARQGAIAAKNAYLVAYDIVGDEDQTNEEKSENICANVGAAVSALNIACKLQCLPSHIRTVAALTLS